MAKLKKQIHEASKVIGYLRVSTEDQDTDNQELSILRFTGNEGLPQPQFYRVVMSSRKGTEERRINELVSKVNREDTVVVTELSRLGRSINELLHTIDRLLKTGVRLVSLKEKIDISADYKDDIVAMTTITIFSLMANIERTLISMRTKEGLAKARANGVRLGRPKGPGRSKLDGMEDEIRNLLGLGVTKSSMTKMFGVSWCALDNFIKTRGLRPSRNPMTVLTRETVQ